MIWQGGRRIASVAGGLLLVVGSWGTAVPSSLAGQERPAPEVLATAGAASADEGIHLFAGARAFMELGPAAVMGHGMYGRGADFSSYLVGAGPAWSVTVGPSLELQAFGGWGLYGESLSPDHQFSAMGDGRRAGGPQLGATFLAPVGSIRAGIGVVGWRGEFRSGDVTVPVRGLRFMAVIGL
jgi:hypothetical protein